MKRMKGLVLGSDPDDFVFGAGFKPSATRYKKDHLSRTFTEIIRPLGFGEAYTLYSCRKTGSIIKWKIDRWSSEELMNALGHEDFSTTQRYLRDILGVYNR